MISLSTTFWEEKEEEGVWSSPKTESYSDYEALYIVVEATEVWSEDIPANYGLVRNCDLNFLVKEYF